MDWLDDVSDLEYENSNRDKDWRRMKDEYYKSGYYQGILDGKEEGLHIGFDEGLDLSKDIGLQVGIIMGRLKSMTTWLEQNPSLHTMQKNINDLDIEIKEFDFIVSKQIPDDETKRKLVELNAKSLSLIDKLL